MKYVENLESIEAKRTEVIHVTEKSGSKPAWKFEIANIFRQMAHKR